MVIAVSVSTAVAGVNVRGTESVFGSRFQRPHEHLGAAALITLGGDCGRRRQSPGRRHDAGRSTRFLNRDAPPGEGRPQHSLTAAGAAPKSLKRRSQRAFMSWEKFTSSTDRFFPSIRILHPLPCHRFDARTRGRSPVR